MKSYKDKVYSNGYEDANFNPVVLPLSLTTLIFLFEKEKDTFYVNSKCIFCQI